MGSFGSKVENAVTFLPRFIHGVGDTVSSLVAVISKLEELGDDLKAYMEVTKETKGDVLDVVARLKVVLEQLKKLKEEAQSLL